MDWSVVLPQVGVGSGWAVVVLGVVMLMRGQLVPRRTLEDALHDRDQWRAESRIKDQQIVVKDEQIGVKDAQLGHLAEVGRTQVAIMHALQRGTGATGDPT